MLFDKDEFLDLLPQKTLRQRLSESWRFRLGAELLLVAGMAWLLWFALIRVKLPEEVKTAYQAWDQATSARDARKVIAMFPSDVVIVDDGQPVALDQFSRRTASFLLAKEIASIAQTTELAWARRPNSDTLQVRAIQVQTIQRPGIPAQSRRLGLTMVWKLTASGWRLKNYNSKTLRPRA